VLRGGPQPRADERPHDERHLRLAAEHVAHLGRLVEERVEAHADEVHEHQLGDGPEPGRRRADRDAEVAHLADRRVDDALGAEPADQPARRAHDAAPGVLDALRLAAAAAGDVLAHDDDGGVALHGLVERLVDGEQERQLASGHGHASS
jgi:hypothetical protein